MQLAARVNRIAISPTSAVMAAAEKLRAQGVDLADFGPGEPDFVTPEHIQRAAIRALEQGKTKYTPTPGIGALREAICKWHATQFGSQTPVAVRPDGTGGLGGFGAVTVAAAHLALSAPEPAEVTV